MGNTSEGAKKAWETIRANKKKRSDAAHKAHATRKANAECTAKELTARAIKAWDTRRAKAAKV